MIKEKLPQLLQFNNVIVKDSSNCTYPGRAAIKEWTSKEAFLRGFQISAKVTGTLLAITLPFAFLEPFAFMVFGSVAIGSILLILGPFLHMKYWAEPVSFFYVESECPYCHAQCKLTPYVNTAFTSTFTVLCPKCGQTAQAQPIQSGCEVMKAEKCLTASRGRLDKGPQ